ncbi:MAG: hypothetical protein K1Y02_17565 [Candidatus Hydrogenedentes bacterium]|nr:hypothetical protein [Candidatus Hydrogenedentota bacterium]
MRFISAVACLYALAVSSAVAGQEEDRAALRNDPVFQAVQQFADTMLAHGRDVYGEKHSPLFVSQLNVVTQRIPEATETDPGVWNGHFEVAGHQPYCQNLIGDLGILDVLKTMTRVTDDPRYDAARRDYLTYLLQSCRDPRSGYIPWGEHVGYDIVHDTIHVGEKKYWHEVKAYNIPWDQLWEVNPEATRHEIEVTFFNHLCDEETFAFNRHATMDGKTNRGTEPCSLLSSAGVYMDAWCWLYRKTGDATFLAWAQKMNALVAKRRSAETGLIPTDEVTRTGLMVYAEAASFAPYLLIAADLLGLEGDDFRKEGIEYLLAYQKWAYTPKRDDTGGPGYYDALDTQTGKPADVGGKRYLEPWQWTDNHEHVGVILASAAFGYGATGDDRLRVMCDSAIEAMRIPQSIAENKTMLSCDAGGVIMSLVTIARRSGDTRYLETARPLVEYVLKQNYKNGCFTSGMEGKGDYYCARAGSGYLASSVLAYALASHGLMDEVPPVRDLQGGLRF